MMKKKKKLFEEDISKYGYLLSEKEKKSYNTNRILYAACGLILGAGILFWYGVDYLTVLVTCVLCIAGYKFPFILLTLRHKQQCNNIIDAIPLWTNSIYSLIGENNIYNAIKLSYEDAPKCIKPDLQELIKNIEIDETDKDAYVGFLARYEIEGFRDIMMKLYEFRNLSKDKLKYEISALNKTLSDLEKLKREKRFKNETFLADTLTLVMMTVPCVYMFFVSLILSNVML